MGEYAGVLRRGEGVPDGATYLPVGTDTALWGRLPARNDAPVLTVDRGATVVVDTLSHEGLLPDQGSDPVAFFAGHGVSADAVLAEASELASRGGRGEEDGPHVVTGPIAVRGAKPGDLLVVDLLDFTPRVPYGVISNRHGRGALPGEMPSSPDNVSVFTGIGPDTAGQWRGWLPGRDGGRPTTGFPLAPFMGIIGVATDTDERAHSVPPGAHGGNLDIKELVADTRVYLPVQVPGALAYLGDPHFAQGDGEVALTALEASLRATVRFDVVPQREAMRAFGELAGPLGQSADYLMPTGLDADLDEAMRACVRQAVAILSARYGMEAHLAYAYLSAATDFRISQVVDLVQGVHAMIRISDFEAVRDE
ncbi:acetamidase/formamidase family protein [Demequina sp. SO4-18]|uniref:acetamidase/formamidase family protein n=1 Tax=Demequina sp. SO4-18 TaxID=3401026 RepID=UPI003B59F3FD